MCACVLLLHIFGINSTLNCAVFDCTYLLSHICVNLLETVSMVTVVPHAESSLQQGM